MAVEWDDLAQVGRIARPHGIRGQLIVNPDTDFPEERFVPGAVMFVRRGADVVPVTITTARFQQGRPVIGLQGVDDRTAAEALAGADVRIPRGALRPLPDGVFYQHDLVGCSVTMAAGPVGTVRAVDDAGGAAARLVVDGADGEILIPLAAEICVVIDPVARHIVIEPPDGLLALNAVGPRGPRAARRRSARGGGPRQPGA